MNLEDQFRADLTAWLGDSTQPGKWFGPQCACIEYTRQHLAAGPFADPKSQQAWEEYWDIAWSVFKARDHQAMVAKWLTPVDLAENHDQQSAQAISLHTAQTRCLATLYGLMATIDAATLIVRQGWRPGLKLSDEIRDCVTRALAAFQNAWGLTPNGEPMPLLGRNFGGAGPTALEAMKEIVNKQGIDAGTAPAWLAVHRLLDYLLTGSASLATAPAGSASPQQVGTTTRTTVRKPPASPPGSPDNPILARILLARRGSSVGELHDLFAMRQEAGPASWYLDPVQIGLTAFQPEFIDSLRLAWRACQAIQPPSAAIRLAPALVDCKIVDGPSAGAVAACAMYAAIMGEPLNSDASASAALKLRPGRSLDDGQPIRLEDIELGDVGHIKEKLGGAHLGRPKTSRKGPLAVPLRKVVFNKSQARDAIEAGWHRPKSGPTMSVVGAANLDDVYVHLTGNARIERVLAEYARQILAEWEQAWTDPDSERGSVLYYVSPAYRLFDRQTGKRDVELFVPLHKAATGEDGEDSLKHEDIDLPNEEDALIELWNKGGELLCISEGPGAGKTTFTRRLLAFLCGQRARTELADRGPLVALRWEESAESADEEWPTDFPSAIARRLENACRECGYGTSSVEAAQYALERGTVVLILDALDQAAPERVAGFHEFLKRMRRENQWHVRVVLTGRTYAVDSIKQKLAFVGDWRFGAVLPFDLRRQYAYFLGPTNRTDSFSAELPRAVDERQINRLVRELPANADDDDRRRELQQLVRFYDDVKDLFGNPNTLYMVRRLAEAGKLRLFHTRSGLYCQTSGFLLQRAARKLRKWPTDARAVDELEHPVILADIQRWESLLAAAAFTMMAVNPGHFRVSNQVDIAELRKIAATRVAQPPTDKDWQLIEQIAQLTNRSLLYKSSEQVWAWPDRRMMEFYCGLHLARNSQPGWVQEQSKSQGPPRCGDQTVRTHAADSDWHESFRFAIEMPTTARDESVLLASLSELFEPVSQRVMKEGEKPWLRPTELMYRAWCLLEDLPAHERAQPMPKLLAGGERVVAAFRQQFQRQLADAGEPGRVARELESGFVTVPALQSGTLDLTKPHRISLESFLLGRTVVTREQYALFDGAYLKLHEQEVQEHQDQLLRYGAQRLSWYDAWCAARHFGGRLPTEAEWEYACGAGSRARYCRIKTAEPSGYRDLESDEDLKLVADFGRTYREGPRDVELGEDLPDGTRRRLLPNAFGLFGMHGGLWEWCVSWYGNFSPTSLAGPEDGSDRVRRGGSWGRHAVYCRTAGRYWGAPSFRDGIRGFRLARVRKGQPVAEPVKRKRAGE
ncbi:MAG: SUMF1/EgtB/PvdO family nonheme iron enzyme [Pirellulales bacterium]